MGTHPIFESDFDCLTVQKSCVCVMLRLVGLRRLDCPKWVTMVTRSSSSLRLSFYNQILKTDHIDQSQLLHADIKKRYFDLLGYDSEIVLLGAHDDEHLDLSNREVKNEEYFYSTINQVYQELLDKGLIEVKSTKCYFNPKTRLIVTDTICRNFSLPIQITNKSQVGNILVWYESINEWVSHCDLFGLIGEYQILKYEKLSGK